MKHSIHISNIHGEPERLAYIELLEGKTYMDFKVRFCPAYGSLDVWVDSDYPDTEQEFTEFLLFYLAQEAMKHYRVLPQGD